MSKMNNNSRKNINKNTSKANKASKKNFKIESLEPRLLMDAAVDWDKNDDSFVNDYVVDNGSLTSVAVSLYAA